MGSGREVDGKWLPTNSTSHDRRRSHNSENHLSPEIYLGETSSSDQENKIPEVVQEQKSERKPFGSYIKLDQNAVDMSNQKDITDKRVPKNLLAELDVEEAKFHALDKENFSPNTLQLLLLQKKGKLEEQTHSKSPKLHSSGKDNKTSKVAREHRVKKKTLFLEIEGEGARGLKLILLHISRFGRFSSGG